MIAKSLFMRTTMQGLARAGRCMSLWGNVPLAPPDKILGLNDAFKNDDHKDKINLGVGAYRDDNGKSVVLPSILQADKNVSNKNLGHEYAPIEGVRGFIDASIRFALGKDSTPIKEGRVAAIQTLSGTGACRIASDFFSQFVYANRINKKMYIPNPTWGNHLNIIKKAGLVPEYYRYFDRETCKLDLKGWISDIEKAEAGSVFLMHPCAHNPTGCDPSKQEWTAISDAISSKKHVVFFDCAYQGFASGDSEEDAWALRYFVQRGHKIVLAQSFAKNFGLYGERVGALSVVVDSPDEKERIESQLKAIVRPMYSNPPVYGARLVQEILNNDSLNAQWTAECKGMADRIKLMRSALVTELTARGSSHDWSHIITQIGMFGFTGMTTQEVHNLRYDFHIYCTEDGRISMAGVNTKNVKYIANAIHEVTKSRK